MEELGDKYDSTWERQVASDLCRLAVLEIPGSSCDCNYSCWAGKGGRAGGLVSKAASSLDGLACTLEQEEGGTQSILDALPSTLDEDLGGSSLLSVVDALPSSLDEDVGAATQAFSSSQGARNADFGAVTAVRPVRPDCRSSECRQSAVGESGFISFGNGVYSTTCQRSEEIETWEANSSMFARSPGLYQNAAPPTLVIPDNGRQVFPCVPAEAYLGIPVHNSNPLIISHWTHLRPHGQLAGTGMHQEDWQSAGGRPIFRSADMTRDSSLSSEFMQFPENHPSLLPRTSVSPGVFTIDMSCHSKGQEQLSRDEDAAYPSTSEDGVYKTVLSTRVADLAKDLEQRGLRQFPAPPWDQTIANRMAMLLGDIFTGLQPKEHDYHMRMHLVQRLTNFCQLFEECKGAVIVPFGSFESNFFTPWGDLDLSLEFPSLGPVSKSRRVKLLKCIERELGRSGTVRKLRFISHARVPLVMFVDTHSGISCDVSVDNGIGLFKSRVLRWICDIDLRCRQLIYLVKCWAKAQGINEPKLGTLNSFAIALLVVFHLQTRSPPILPPLGVILGDDKRSELPGKWAGNSRDRHLAECSQRIQALIGEGFGQQNKSTVPELFLSFFTQFSSVENLWTQGMVVRTFAGQWGDRSTISQAWKEKHYTMNVEDPFDYTENCARSVHENTLPDICVAFSSTADALSRLQPGSDLAWLRLCLFCWPQGSAVPEMRSKMGERYGSSHYGQMYGPSSGQYRHPGSCQQNPFGRSQHSGWHQQSQFQESNRLDFFGTKGKGQNQTKAGMRKKAGPSASGLQHTSATCERQGEKQIGNWASEDDPSCLASDIDSAEQSSPELKLKTLKQKTRAAAGKHLASESQVQQVDNNVSEHGIAACGCFECPGGLAATTATFPRVHKCREKHKIRGRKGKQHESGGPVGPLEEPSHPNCESVRTGSRNSQQGRPCGKNSGRGGDPSASQGPFRSPVGAGMAQSHNNSGSGSGSKGPKSYGKNKQNFTRWAKKNQEMCNSTNVPSTSMADQSRQENQPVPRRGNFRILVGPGIPDSNLSQS